MAAGAQKFKMRRSCKSDAAVACAKLKAMSSLVAVCLSEDAWVVTASSITSVVLC